MKNNEIIFLTVGTEEQKQLCEKLIEQNKDAYDIPIIVVADNEYGCRIGSGGALLNLISQYYEKGCKIAVINSGGKSKRCVNYAVKGKVFTNIEVEGRTLPLFEMLYDSIKHLMSCFKSGVLVCCSDILVDARSFAEKLCENAGFCIRADINTATRHGVMFHNAKMLLKEYPHKCTSKELNEMRLKYNTDDFLIDTGAIYFKEELCLKLKNATKDNCIIEKLADSKTELNLYADIIPLLAEQCNKTEYLNSGNCNKAYFDVKNILFDTVSEYALKVIIIEKQDFRHFGSLKESLTNIIELSGKNDRFVSMNSHVVDSYIGKNTVLDNVILKQGCRIGNNCIVSDISFDEGTEIEDNKVVCGIKLKDDTFVTIICDINEDPKKVVNTKELWETERFYKGISFNDSLEKYRNSSEESTYSISYCVNNADVKYLYTRSNYITELISLAVNEEYLKIRKKILDNYFKKYAPLSQVEFKSDKLEVNLPLRINMSGTWTDAMPYCIDNGGQVINMAIAVDGEKPITVTIEKLAEKRIEFSSDGAVSVFDFNNYETAESDLSDFILHIAALKTIGITKETVLENGFRLTTHVSDIDKGSGLGISSILLGGCIKAFNEMFGLNYDDSEILKMVFVAEQVMGTGGGWQDQVGGLLPSLKAGTTFPGIEQDLHVEYIAIPDSFNKIFTERIAIIPTGQRHFGRFIVNNVADRYLSGNKESIYGHEAIRALNDDLINAIRSENYPDFCNCINRHFQLLKFISPLVSNHKIDQLISDCLINVADAACVCGAGGGGYLFAVLKENVTVNQVQKFINENYPYIKSKVKQIQILNEV